MAKFRITRARQDLGLTPSTAVRANVDVSTAAGAVGQAVGQAGLEIAGQFKKESARKETIRIKNRKNLDALSSRQADEKRKQIKSDIEIMKLNTPPEKWEEEAGKIVTAGNTEIAAFDFSPQEASKQQIISVSESKLVPEEALIDSSRAISAATITSAEEGLTDDFRLGREDIAQKKIDFVDTMKNNGVPALEIVSKLKAAEEAGSKLRKADVLDAWQKSASEFPELTIAQLNKELDDRRTGEGIVSEEDFPSESATAVINMANNRITQRNATAQANLNAAQTSAEKDFYLELAQPGANTAEIMSRVHSSVLDTAAIRRLEDDEGDIAQKRVDKTWPLSDNDAAKDGLNTMLTAVASGQLDFVEASRAINAAAAKDLLTEKTFNSMKATAGKGGNDAIDESVIAFTKRVQNVFVGKLTDRQARLRIRAEARELTSEEQRQAGSVGFLVQVGKEQVALFRAALNQELRNLGKETVSGTEATSLAATVWERFRDKPLSVQIREFKEFSGKSIPRPQGFPVSTWDEATPRDRANIVTASAEGMSINDIMDSITR